MSQPSVSIIMSITDRTTNLSRSLFAWSKLTYPNFDFAVISNGVGNPELENIANSFKDQLHITFYKEPIQFNINEIWNKYGRQSTGEYVLYSMMDELISDGDIIDKILEQPHESRCSIFTYFLTERQTNEIENYDWRTDVHNIPLPYTTETTAGLISHITGAFRTYWDWFGWFRYGPGHLWLDQDLHLRERQLGNHCHTAEGVYAVHQWHKADLGYTGGLQPGFHYANEAQARLLEPAERDTV